MGKTSTGALDQDVRITDQLNPDIDFTRPPGGGKELFDIVGSLSGKRILDVGCGLGPYRQEIEKRGGKWIGVDLKGPGCSVIADGLHLPFPDGSFDGVLCAAVLEHVPDLDIFMMEIKRVLAAHGVLFGYAAFLEPFHGMSYYHMTHLGLEHLLIKHGFRPNRIFAARNGTAYQIESMFFPRYIPVVQPAFRAVAQWSMAITMWLNRTVRSMVRALRGGQRDDGTDAIRYKQLLSLRFAVGFNFVARRSDSPGVIASYSAFSDPNR